MTPAIPLRAREKETDDDVFPPAKVPAVTVTTIGDVIDLRPQTPGEGEPQENILHTYETVLGFCVMCLL